MQVRKVVMPFAYSKLIGSASPHVKKIWIKTLGLSGPRKYYGFSRPSGVLLFLGLGSRIHPMTGNAHLRQACALAAQLPEKPEDVRAVMGHLQRLVDDYLLSAEDGARLVNVVAFGKDLR